MNIQMIMQAMQNPGNVLRQLNLPQNMTPQQAIESLMNSGRMSQQQYEQLRQMAERISKQINPAG